MFEGCFMIFKGVSRMLQEISKVFKKKFHVAWHSSQLPEQKEGLFYEASVFTYLQVFFSNILLVDTAQRNKNIFPPLSPLFKANGFGNFPVQSFLFPK